MASIAGMFAEYHGQIDFILYIWYNIKDIVSNGGQDYRTTEIADFGVEGLRAELEGF